MSNRIFRCFQCAREFTTGQGLGLHQMHARKAKALAKKERICPERRSAEELRDIGLRLIRLRARVGLTGRDENGRRRQ